MDILRNNYFRIIDGSNIPEIDPPNRKIGNFYEETIIQAKYIYENKTKDLYLFLSGGLDSEYMVNVFHKLNYKFTPVIARYHGVDDNGNELIYNDHDNTYAFKICNDLNLTPLVIDFNLKDYIESGEILTVGQTCDCWCPVRLTLLKICKIISDKYNGCVLLANELYPIVSDITYDDPHWKYDISRVSKTWYFLKVTQVFGMIRYFQNNQIEGSPAFLGYSSEIILSFLLDPEIIKLANNEYPGRVTIHKSKGKIFNNYSGFNLRKYSPEATNLPDDRIKLGGFELFNTSKLNKHPNMIKLYDNYHNDHHKKWFETYDKFVKFMSVNQ